MVAAFDVKDVNSNPGALRPEEGRRDQCRAHPAACARRLRAHGCATYFDAHGHDTGLDDAGFAEAADLVQTRIVVLGDAWDLLKFLDDGVLRARREVGRQGVERRRRAGAGRRLAALEAVTDWTTANIEAALKTALLEDLELKPRKAFGPIRVAATGASISPPLFESLELLGRERTLARLRAAREHAAAARVGREKRCRIFGSLLVGPRHARWRARRPHSVRKWPVTSGYGRPMGYGVIGNTAVSGTAILGSSPGTPANERSIRSAFSAEICFPSHELVLAPVV